MPVMCSIYVGRIGGREQIGGRERIGGREIRSGKTPGVGLAVTALLMLKGGKGDRKSVV